MLQLERIGTHNWKFVHPEGYRYALDELDRGCDLYEMNDLARAEKVFIGIVNEIPDHLDALHHWALVRDEAGDLDQAKGLWEKAVSMGKKAFPETFEIGKDVLLWGVLDNRPFLRCLQGLGLSVFKSGDVSRANEIFMENLKLNPNDSQDVRALAIQSFFCLRQHGNVLEICKVYPDDCLPDTLYGRAMAYFLIDDRKNADKSLKQAIKYLPKIAQEIIKDKHRKPKSMSTRHIRVGGEDDAYDYWQRNKKLWMGAIGAIDWVRMTLGERGAGIAAKKGSGKGLVYQIKIVLKDVKPSVWRKFQVRGDATLYDLHFILQEIMGWLGGHLHQFTIDGKRYSVPDYEFESAFESIDERIVKIKDVIDSEKEKIIYEYDFGDGWEHSLTVEKILPVEKGVRYPVCLDGRRACPPEDCGGPYGYKEFLDAVNNPGHSEHKSMLEWIGGEFDPEDFNLREINEALKHVDKTKDMAENLL